MAFKSMQYSLETDCLDEAFDDDRSDVEDEMETAVALVSKANAWNL